MRKLFTVSFLVALVLGAGSAGAFEREIAVRSGGTIEFDLNTGGDIIIVGWGNESVRVSADLSGRNSDNIDLTVEERSGGILVRSRYVEQRRSQSSSLKFEVRVPSIFDVKIDSMGGGLSIDGVEGTFSGKTMGGDITIDSAREYVKAKTMGGDIRIKEADGWVKATTMAGDVRALVIGGHDVELTSMSGEVTLVMPEGADLDIEIELSFTNNSSRNYQIYSDFPIDQSESEKWDYDHGTPRKTISGVASGGGNRVVIRTINGNVYLKKSQ